MNHIVGSTVLVRLTVTNEGELAEAVVTATIREPDGTESAGIVTNPSTGVYATLVDLTMPGPWYVVWTASAAGLTEVIECCVVAVESILVGSA